MSSPQPPAGPTPAAVLPAVADNPWAGDLDDNTVTAILSGLGVTDCDLAVFVAAAPVAGLPGGGETYRQRMLLGALSRWLPTEQPPDGARTGLAALYPDLFDAEDDDRRHPPYPGLTAPAAIWWHLAFDFWGMRGDKPRDDAAQWYALDPARGWLAMAAGLSRAEWSQASTEVSDDTLWTMMALFSSRQGAFANETRCVTRLLAARAAWNAYRD